MPSVPLPEQPSLEQLRKQARELQRAIRSGERRALKQAGLDQRAPDYPLNKAQTTLARRYGFASWARLRRHVDALSARTWVLAEPPADESFADRFLRLAVLNYGNDNPTRRSAATAVELLDQHPDLPAADIAVAAVCADVGATQRHLDDHRDTATAPTGPYGWSPLLYVAYARLDVDLDSALATARLLLESGADPDDGRFFGGRPTPFTVLTGVFGGGELDQPPHPHALALARVLLSAGAEPNDGQTLYNRMFRSEDDFLDLLFEFGLGAGDGGPWRRRLPDVLPAPTAQLQTLLDWAVTHDQRDRVARLARNGVDVLSPLDSGVTPLELARRNGHRELAQQLLTLGATESTVDPVDSFIAAALAGDAAAVHATAPDVVAAARTARPGLVVWAAAQERVAAVELLIAAGFDVNALGRGDIPREQEWQTALHTAVERGNAPLVQRLLELGADTQLRDRRFDGTAADWARHLAHPELLELLGE